MGNVARSANSKWRVTSAFGLLVVVAISVTVMTLSSNTSASGLSAPQPDIPGNAIPAVQLSQSAGIQNLSQMSQIMSSRIPLWLFKDGKGKYSETQLGMTASLQQGFVLSSAISQYGPLNSGLVLPLPLDFAMAHPGPAEVFDNVWSFTNSNSPQLLLNDPTYMNSAVPGVVQLASGSVNGGLVWSIDSPANGGMQEYRFAWAQGSYLVEVNVVGAQLTLADARAIALQVGV